MSADLGVRLLAKGQRARRRHEAVDRCVGVTLFLAGLGLTSWSVEAARSILGLGILGSGVGVVLVFAGIWKAVKP